MSSMTHTMNSADSIITKLHVEITNHTSAEEDRTRNPSSQTLNNKLIAAHRLRLAPRQEVFEHGIARLGTE